MAPLLVKSVLLVAVIGWTGRICAVPVDNYPLAYNLQALATPGDVNGLSFSRLQKAKEDVATTIAEVQKVLATDPSLPRLTKGEIAELFETVTKEELAKSVMVGDHRRAKQMEALMVVLPYSTNNVNSDNIQDLYTKAPITKVVQTEDKSKKPIEIEKKISTTKPLIPSIKTTPASKIDHQKPIRQEASPVYVQEEEAIQEKEKEKSHQENISNLLASMGLKAEAPTTTVMPSFRPIPAKTAQISDDVKEVLQSLGLWQENEAPMEFMPVIQETTVPITEGLAVSEDYVMVMPEVNIEKLIGPPVVATDFFGFKPLPQEQVPMDSDLFDYFKSVGLIANQKAVPSKTVNEKDREPKTVKVLESIPEIKDLPVPTKMLKTLSNMGVKSNIPETTAPSTTSFPWTTSKRARVFGSRTTGSTVATTTSRTISKKETQEKDLQNLQHLLQTIQKLEKLNKNLTDEEFAMLDLKNFNFSDSLLSQGPNPVDHTEKYLGKNEVKRQEDNPPTRFSLNITTDLGNDVRKETIANITASEDNGIRTILAESEGKILNSGSAPEAETTIKLEEPEVVTTTQGSESPASLEDSFAGGLDPVTEGPPPPVKKNGFYFLADWNSFLEVGEGKERVEVRFAPKVGDARLFIPVNVP